MNILHIHKKSPEGKKCFYSILIISLLCSYAVGLPITRPPLSPTHIMTMHTQTPHTHDPLVWPAKDPAPSAHPSAWDTPSGPCNPNRLKVSQRCFHRGFAQSQLRKPISSATYRLIFRYIFRITTRSWESRDLEGDWHRRDPWRRTLKLQFRARHVYDRSNTEDRQTNKVAWREPFLAVSSHLYERVCSSVGLSVRIVTNNTTVTSMIRINDK